jgi:hypothetical protein
VKSILKYLALVIAGIIGVVLVILGLDLVFIRGLEIGAVAVPKPPAAKVVALPQGWTSELSRQYHYTTQGTKILPKAWFQALEEPSLDPVFTGVKLASREYLSRFGFLYEPNARLDDLPLGFATDEWDESVDYVIPPITRKTEMTGLTCAACHTGRIDFELRNHKRLGFLIEGGSAMINLSKFQEAVGQALFWTLQYRLKPFIAEVQTNGDARTAKEIEDDLRTYIASGIASRDYAKEHKLYPVDAGFSRTDALGLIGNRVFGPLSDENQTVTDAPVNFPHLWDTAWFDWVQYNASIRMPLARNIGEALGVGAAVKPARTIAEPYKSTVRIADLKWLEDTLGGGEPFPLWSNKEPHKGGLRPPRWEDVRAAVARAGGLADEAANAAMTIDEPLRVHGANLYVEHCARCHLPPSEELRREWSKKESKYWEIDPRSGKKFLRLQVVDLSEIGTDPNQAVNFYRRFAVIPNPMHESRSYERGAESPDRLAVGYPRSGVTETISAEEGLYRVTAFLRQKYFREQHLFDKGMEEKRYESDRFRTLPISGKKPEVLLDQPLAIVQREVIDDVIRANLGYKARPLDGIWATPPYLHNGSVPNLEQMLSPAERRDTKFYLGTTWFDPVKVGYHTEPFPGAFLMDTTISGNRNIGHEFRNYTLEEFEAALRAPTKSIDPKNPPSRAERWDHVLQAKTEELDNDALWRLKRAKTAEILSKLRAGDRSGIANPKFLGFRGVLGPEFTTEERRALVEYLKSL